MYSLSDADPVFEAVPETEVAKKEAFQKLDSVLPQEAIVASATSTFFADLVVVWSRRLEYVLNAQSLKLACLVPLVELSPYKAARPVQRMR